jgi:hypothetical protein
MNCDRCREQLPVGDGIDHRGQTLCLACYLQGAASSQPSATLHCWDLAGAESEQRVQMSLMSTVFVSPQI